MPNSEPIKHPFSDLLILELASVLAGPGVGQFFAELGARVIKIENPGTNGDVTRKWKLSTEAPETDRPAYFTSANWGKESLAVDIRKPQGLKIIEQLATIADVVIASYKPGDAKKLGVSYQQLSAINPKLVYGDITGYGPNVNRAGYDAVVQAESGFMHLNGQPDSPPTKMPVALIDILAGHQLKEGILAALYMREKTGLGDYVQVSLINSAIASLANQAANYLVAGHNPRRIGSEHPNIAPYGTLYTTKDNLQITLAVGDDRQFASLCQILNVPGLALEPRFLTNAARVKHRDELSALLQQAIAGVELQPLLTRLIKAHVPAGAVNDVATVLSDPAHQNQLLQAENKEHFAYAGLRSVVFESGKASSKINMTPPPRFSEHSAQILAGLLHLSEQEIENLRAGKVIA